MTYATQQDIETAFGVDELIELTDPEAGVVDAVQVTRALEDADSIINAHLNGRYKLPISETPRLLNRLSCDIARKFLHQGDGKNPTDEVMESYKDSLKMLEKISNGKMELALTASGSKATEHGTIEIQTSKRKFSDKELADW